MRVWVAGLVVGMMSVPALSQTVGLLELASDERRRGVSWSDGEPVVRAGVSVLVTPEVSIDATAVSLWGSSRHGGADAVVDVQAGYSRQFGGWRLTADATYRLFPGASDQGYAEIGGSAGFLIGPAGIDLFTRYAPRQSAIGGDNLYMGTALTVGLPGTPFTLSGHIGRSSGTVRDPGRAERLRPDGRYWDHGLALDYRKGPWLAGLRYANSSIDRDASDHVGATLIGRVGMSF
jgi:uncharacterized protein (TIGR02001 family)